MRDDEARCKSAEEALATASDLMRRAVLAIERGELAVEEFARTTAKQLQHPLEAVRAFAQSLQAAPDSTPETLALADRIDAEAARMQIQLAEQLARAGPGTPPTPE